MFKKKGKLLLTLGLTLSLMSTSVLAKPGQGKYGDIAYDHIYELSEEIGARVAGSSEEFEAMEYIKDAFEDIGYKTEIQEFTINNRGNKSYNVIATKDGKSSKELIVGGHYDSVNTDGSKGADDSASGIGVILETAERLKNIKTPYTVKFVAFGAEEGGLKGSKHYVSEMDKKEIENTVAMINLDSLIAGDKMYVHGSLGDKGFVREQALNIAEKKKLNLEINPGLNSTYPEGTTGGWSDHGPFDNVGIPYAAFEATNWEIGDNDGYTQTENFGSIWHTKNDNLEFFETNFPGRVEERLTTFSEVLTELIKFFGKTSTAK